MFSKKDLIILFPIVLVYVITANFFGAGLLASIAGLLTIPITILIQNLLSSNNDVASKKISNSSKSLKLNVTDVDEGNEVYQYKKEEHVEHVSNNPYKTVGILLWSVVIILILYVAYKTLTPMLYKEEVEIDEGIKTITNPVYKSNPTNYIKVDFGNEIDSLIPTNSNLWVEKITYDLSMYYITVSYPRKMYTGEEIIELAEILIPGVHFMANNETQRCMTREVSQMILNKYVQIDMSSYVPSILSESGDDLVIRLVEAGYGDPTESFIFNRHQSCGFDESLNPCPQRYGDGDIKDISQSAYNYFAIQPRTDLKEAHELSVLKKVGKYGKCTI